MTPIEFVYWLQGWVEMERGKQPDVVQWNAIVAHLATVFNKVTPSLEDLLEDDGEAEASLQDALEEFIEEINIDPRKLFDEPTQFVPGQRPLPAPYPVHPGDEGHFPGPLICAGDKPDLSKTQYCCSSDDSTPQDDWAQPRVLPK